MAKSIKKSKEVEPILEEKKPEQVVNVFKENEEGEVDLVAQLPIKEEPKEIKPIPPIASVVIDERTDEEKLLAYIANSHSEKIELNPFLKSLYPLPSFGVPPVYLQIGESKRMKLMIGNMVAKNLILVIDSSYLKLGSFYYAENDTKTRHHNLDTIKIYAVKIG